MGLALLCLGLTKLKRGFGEFGHLSLFVKDRSFDEETRFASCIFAMMASNPIRLVSITAVTAKRITDSED